MGDTERPIGFTLTEQGSMIISDKIIKRAGRSPGQEAQKNNKTSRTLNRTGSPDRIIELTSFLKNRKSL